HKYATERQLLANLPFQRRTVHLLVPVNPDGSLRTDWLTLLTSPRAGDPDKADVGRELWLPRFPGENNGGKTYFLAEGFATVFGLRREGGDPLPEKPDGRSDRNPV